MHISLKTIWRTQKDTQVCPVCNALEGYTWTREAATSTLKSLFTLFTVPFMIQDPPQNAV